MDVKRVERAAPRAAATQACKSRASVRPTADLTSQSGKTAVAVAFGNGTVDLLHQLVVVHLSAFPVAGSAPMTAGRRRQSSITSVAMRTWRCSTA